MTPDKLRALADALPEGVHWSDPITPDMLAEAIKRFCADAQPVAWIGPSRPKIDGADHRVLRQDYDASHGYGWSRDTAKANGFLPLYTHPAPAASQGEPKRNQPLLDLLAVIHCDGGHHTEAVGIDQSIKDAQAAVCELKRELAMGKREPLTYEQMRAVLIAEARRIAEQAGEKDPDSLPVDEEMLAQVMLAGRAVERAHGIGGSDAE